MFIIMIGLVGVSSLVYVGRHEVQEGGRLERASNLGRAAIKDIRIRGMLGPRFQPVSSQPTLLRSDVWAVGSLTTATPPLATVAPLYYDTTTGNFGTSINSTQFVVPPPYVIDPLGVAAAYGAVFPYGALRPLDPAQAVPPGPPRGMIRLTILPPGLTDAARAALTPAQLQSLAEDVFRGQDDLVAPFKPGSTNPAEQQFYISNSNRIKRQSAGEYSWLATVVPSQTSEFTNNLMTVSVAVYHKRLLTIPGFGEKSVFVKEILPGSPLEVTLRSPSAGDPTGKLSLAVKAGQWLMLNGAVPNYSSTNPPSPLNTTHFRFEHKWYRIVGMDDAPQIDPDDSNYNIRRVSLAGPDWNAQTMTVTPNLNVPGTTASAYIFDGIIGVYEKAMRLEGPSEWTSY